MKGFIDAKNWNIPMLHMVAMPPEKKEFLSLINYYEKMLDKLGVHVELQKTPDKKMIKEGAFDLVVVATGRGAAKNIDLDTDGSVTICTAYDILSERVMAGLNVLVIGGGSVGCETAQYLAREASISPNQIYHMLQYQYMPCDKVLNMMNSSRRNIAIVDIIKMAGRQFGRKPPPLPRRNQPQQGEKAPVIPVVQPLEGELRFRAQAGGGVQKTEARQKGAQKIAPGCQRHREIVGPPERGSVHLSKHRDLF